MSDYDSRHYLNRVAHSFEEREITCPQHRPNCTVTDRRASIPKEEPMATPKRTPRCRFFSTSDTDNLSFLLHPPITTQDDIAVHWTDDSRGSLAEVIQTKPLEKAETFEKLHEVYELQDIPPVLSAIEEIEVRSTLTLLQPRSHPHLIVGGITSGPSRPRSISDAPEPLGSLLSTEPPHFPSSDEDTGHSEDEIGTQDYQRALEEIFKRHRRRTHNSLCENHGLPNIGHLSPVTEEEEGAADRKPSTMIDTLAPSEELQGSTIQMEPKEPKKKGGIRNMFVQLFTRHRDN